MHYQRRLCCKELYNIRKINRRICSVYFKPTLKYIRIVRYNLKKINDDKQTFQKYINKTLLDNLITCLKKIKKHLCNIDRR